MHYNILSSMYFRHFFRSIGRKYKNDEDDEDDDDNDDDVNSQIHNIFTHITMHSAMYWTMLSDIIERQNPSQQNLSPTNSMDTDAQTQIHGHSSRLTANQRTITVRAHRTSEKKEDKKRRKHNIICL